MKINKINPRYRGIAVNYPGERPQQHFNDREDKVIEWANKLLDGFPAATVEIYERYEILHKELRGSPKATKEVSSNA